MYSAPVGRAYDAFANFGGYLSGERVVRRLAVILAADVVGYSRLMGRNENGTLSRLIGHRIYQRREDVGRMVDGLRFAGLPE